MFRVGDWVRVKRELILPANSYMIELCGGKVYQIIWKGDFCYQLNIPDSDIPNGTLLRWGADNLEYAFITEEAVDFSGLDTLIG